jgi:LmbE family N-acetylglucosaminyl deacetylase
MTCAHIAFALSAVLATAALLHAQEVPAAAPPLLPPDARMKADILLVVAHPDDETAVGAYLAKAVFDDHKSVAVVYCNRGTGGGNSAGNEQSTSMGAIREIEGRQALSAFGITNVWFLEGRDTPSQDLFQSLQNWRHGNILESVVRIVRLTRPEIIITWLPHFVAGENHGDHQASGVIATEAFDMAGDPTVFPVQVTPPRERADIGNANEGLIPWQPKKIYYVSDASNPLPVVGPTFDATVVSPARKIPYYRLAMMLGLPHLTQGDVSDAPRKAMRSGDEAPIIRDERRWKMIFGKAVVPCTPKGDVFEGVTAVAAPYVRPAGYSPEPLRGIGIELGGAFHFYRMFWKAHALDHLAGLVTPEIEVAAGSYLNVPMLLTNGTSDSVEITLKAKLPTGWSVAGGEARYRVAPGQVYPVSAFVRAPGEVTPTPVPVTWEASKSTAKIGAVTILVSLTEWSLPQ